MDILCLHQSSELYGSDRSFVSALHALPKQSKIDVILPFNGPIESLIPDDFGNITFFNKGVLRKSELKRHFFFLWDLVSAVRFYKKKFSSYDTVYINTTVMVSALVAARFFAKSNKRFFCHVREIPAKNQITVFRWLLKFSKTDLIFNSQETQRAYALPGAVVHNGVPKPIKTSSKASFKSCNDKVKILLIGRINSWKGQTFFVEALSRLSDSQLSEISVDIVGSPPKNCEFFEDKLKNQINLLKLNKTVKITPFKQLPDNFFRECDFVIVPSTLPEPFGRVAVEGMSYGKPVIAAAHGGLTEIVSNSKNGLLFEPNSITELCSTLTKAIEISKDEYCHLSKNALLTYQKKFTEKAYIKNLSKILTQ